MNQFDDLHTDEFASVVDQLRAHRPQATALELDAVKQRVRGRVATRPAGRRARSASLMKSRLAILSMLVTGMLLSTAGAGIAVTGVVHHADAASEQYKPGTPSGDVLGEDNSKSPSGGVAGEQSGNSGSPSGTAGESAGVQPTRQVEAGAGSSTLPFTGFLAIPVLLGGIALLTAGLVLRRRAGDERA